MPKIVLLSGLIAATALSGCASMGGREQVVRAPKVCQDITIPIYFAPDAATITPDGRRLLASEARKTTGCSVDAVSVLGLADAAGDPAANLELSRQRAASVVEAIRKAGLPAAQFEASAAGQEGSTTAAGQVPVRRRADVTLKLSRPK